MRHAFSTGKHENEAFTKFMSSVVCEAGKLKYNPNEFRRMIDACAHRCRHRPARQSVEARKHFIFPNVPLTHD